MHFEIKVLMCKCVPYKHGVMTGIKVCVCVHTGPLSSQRKIIYQKSDIDTCMFIRRLSMCAVFVKGNVFAKHQIFFSSLTPPAPPPLF